MEKRVSWNKRDKRNKTIEREDGVKWLNEITKANTSLTLLSYSEDAVSILTNLSTNSDHLLNWNKSIHNKILINIIQIASMTTQNNKQYAYWWS